MTVVEVSAEDFSKKLGVEVPKEEVSFNTYYLIEKIAGAIVDKRTGAAEFINFKFLEVTEEDAAMKLLLFLAPKFEQKFNGEPLVDYQHSEFDEERYYKSKEKQAVTRRVASFFLPLMIFFFLIGIILIVRG